MKETIIQKLTVVTTPLTIFEVGFEKRVGINTEGREINEITQVGSDEGGVFSEFHILDDEGDLIASVENAPVIVEYRQISVHD